MSGLSRLSRLIGLTLSAAVMLPSSAAAAERWLPDSFERGVNFTADSRTGYSSAESRVALDAAKAAGVKHLAITVRWYAATPFANSVGADVLRTATDSSLRAVAGQAAARGMTVTLRLDVQSRSGDSAAPLAPTDQAAFLSSYSAFVRRYAAWAQTQPISRLDIGSNLHNLDRPAYEQYWRQIIAQARSVFSGQLLYTADQDDVLTVPFWDALDAVGVSCGWTPGSGTAEFTAAWWSNEPVRQLRQFAARTGKPTLCTDLGRPSIAGNVLSPLNAALPTGVYDGQAQADALDGALTALRDERSVSGVWIARWPAAPPSGPGDLTLSVTGKPAQSTLSDWYTGSRQQASVPVPPPPAATDRPAVLVPAPRPSAPPVVSLNDVAETFTSALSAHAAASAARGVAHVQFLLDGRVIGQDARAPYELTWRADKNVSAGTHTLIASAVDKDGNAAFSQPVTVTRKPAPVSLMLSSKPTRTSAITKTGRTVKRKVTVRGQLRGAGSGTVTVEVQQDGKLTRKQTAARYGTFTVSVPVRKAGRVQVRARYLGDSLYLPAVTSPVTLHVR